MKRYRWLEANGGVESLSAGLEMVEKVVEHPQDAESVTLPAISTSSAELMDDTSSQEDSVTETPPAGGLSMADFGLEDMELVSEDNSYDYQMPSDQDSESYEYQFPDHSDGEEFHLPTKLRQELMKGGYTYHGDIDEPETFQAIHYQLLSEMSEAKTREKQRARSRGTRSESPSRQDSSRPQPVWETAPSIKWSKVTNEATFPSRHGPRSSAPSNLPQRTPSEHPPTEPEQTPLYHYPDSSTVPPSLQKYYRNRLSLFSLYHLPPGINLTSACWYSVTPEPIALKIATHLLSSRRPQNTPIIIDAFAGSGGNTIAFARHPLCRKVIAIEKDPEVLACGMHNASLYGVGAKICWVLGDAFEVLDRGKNAGMLDVWRREAGSGGLVVFGSPPWGGPGYKQQRSFDLQGMVPYGLARTVSMAREVSGDVCLYLPRTSDLEQLREYVEMEGGWSGGEGTSGVVDYRLNGYSKAICAWLGRSMSPRFRWAGAGLDEGEDYDDEQSREDEDRVGADGDGGQNVASCEWKMLSSAGEKRAREESLVDHGGSEYIHPRGGKRQRVEETAELNYDDY